MQLEEYQPECQLIKQDTEVRMPKYPVIEAHGHLGLWNPTPPSPEEMIDRMDEAGIVKFVDLDAGVAGPDNLIDQIKIFKNRYPDRFNHAAGINWALCLEDEGSLSRLAVKQIRDQYQAGARALKIWKNVGLSVRDNENNLVMVDDPRLEPVWHTAGELNMPVFIHVGDPLAFFKEPDIRNERFDELEENPAWCFHKPGLPSMDQIITGMENIVKRFPNTVFIGAHVGCIAEDLKRVGDLLDRCPNYHIDISARLNELGRQPYSSRDFIERYADRILFGTDTAAEAATTRIWYRFLETRDEYFPYSVSQIPDQGRWNIYGIGLDDETLKKIYSENAEKLLF